MNDDWNDFMPDSGENGITFGEAGKDVAVFLAKVLGGLLVIAVFAAAVAYSIWREWAIFNFLVNG